MKTFFRRRNGRKFSRKFLIELKFHPEPAYRLAQASDLDPSILSAWISGIRSPREDDPRILKLAALLQVSCNEIFEAEGVIPLEEEVFNE